MTFSLLYHTGVKYTSIKCTWIKTYQKTNSLRNKLKRICSSIFKHIFWSINTRICICLFFSNILSFALKKNVSITLKVAKKPDKSEKKSSSSTPAPLSSSKSSTKPTTKPTSSHHGSSSTGKEATKTSSSGAKHKSEAKSSTKASASSAKNGEATSSAHSQKARKSSKSVKMQSRSRSRSLSPPYYEDSYYGNRSRSRSRSRSRTRSRSRSRNSASGSPEAVEHHRKAASSRGGAYEERGGRGRGSLSPYSKRRFVTVHLDEG